VTFLVGDPNLVLRTVVLGVLAYIALVIILRVSGKRTLSQFNAFDFIVTVALGSTLATILLSSDVSLLQGVLAFLVLVGMQFLITWSSMRSKRVREAAKSEPTALVYRGRMLREPMHRERVLESEVDAAIRSHGHASVAEVDLVVLETDGTFAVVPRLPAEAERAGSVASLLPEEGRPDERP
jgi:uncharacterized membrane protein YcaP (DUF421 family)